ncbi:MAG: hypothetical protein U5R31_07875 [Acidimicrobiia bacterium]|nr:hypothetical protein [Acidimicrobiia bacterium]
MRDHARTLADTVAPSSLRATKHQIYTDLHRDVGTSVEEAEVRLRDMMTGSDFAEGVAAFSWRSAPVRELTGAVLGLPPALPGSCSLRGAGATPGGAS